MNNEPSKCVYETPAGEIFNLHSVEVIDKIEVTPYNYDKHGHKTDDPTIFKFSVFGNSWKIIIYSHNEEVLSLTRNDIINKWKTACNIS